MAVPYTFANATSAIPLSQLDSNFATAVTIGNVAVQLGNTATTLGNVTLANVTITSVSTPITVTQGGTGNSSAFTANAVVYAPTTSTLATGSALTFDGTNLGIGTGSPSVKLDVVGQINNTGGVLFGGSDSSSLTGTIQYLTGSGLTLYSKTGSTNDFTLLGAAGNNIMLIPTGTINLSFPQAGVNFTANGIGLGGTSPSSGTGITFPATQSASSDANTLDDYEEGTWTPTDVSGAGLSFTTVGGNYTKIGRQVIAYFNVTFPSTASTAQVTIGGLPYAASSASAVGNPGSGGFTYQTASISNVTMAIGSGASQFNWWTLAGASVNNISASTFTTRGWFQYFTNT